MPSLLLEALLAHTDVASETVGLFVATLSGQPAVTMTTEDFRILSAPGVGAVIRELRPLHDTHDPIDNPCSPTVKAKLYEACRGVARKLGGQVATSFASVGLHGEALAVPHPAACTPPAPDTSAQMQALTAAIAAALAQKGTRKAKPSYKFDGVLQQGGDVAIRPVIRGGL